MDWFAPHLDYCERTGPGLWAEPLNAASNLAFLAAAALAWGAARRDPACRALAALVFLVGIGSGLFHTVAQRWAMLADVIPIALFVHAFLYVALRRLLGVGVPAALALTLAFIVLGLALTPLLDAATGLSLGALSNNSVDYLPALLGLLGLAAALGLRRPADPASARALLAAAGLFAASLAARTLDRAVCAGLPTGTHVLWHLLNALVLALLIRALRRRGPRKADP